LPDNARLLLDDLVTGDPAAIVLAHVTITIRGPGEHVERTSFGGMSLAAATTLQDLRALILRQHALHLKQQVVLRRGANLAVEKDDLDAGTAQLINQQNLIGVAARQAVGRMNVEPIKRAGRRQITQPLQRWADQGGAAVAVIDKTMVGQNGQLIGRNPRLQRRELTGNGVAARLLLIRYAGIERRTQILSHVTASSSVWRLGVWHRSSA
jgi:hypothetical protein